jgi:hypothetical protein
MEYRIEHQLENLPYTKQNIDALRTLSNRKGPLGGAAAGALFKVDDTNRVAAIGEILRNNDWNYVDAFARVSKLSWSLANFDYLIEELLKQKKKISTFLAFLEI